MPAFPGAHTTSGRREERRRAWTMACSRAPDPTTRTRGLSDGANELVDRDRGQGLVACCTPGAELQGDPSDRLLVGRLDHVDEVPLPERCPLRLHGGAELLHLPVDLLDPGRVVLDRLDTVGGESREHDVRRHVSLLWLRTAWRRTCTMAGRVSPAPFPVPISAGANAR